MSITEAPAEPISLRRLLADAQFIGEGDVLAESCTCDASQVRRGDVFVAVSGASSDGHDVAHQAVQRGAAAVICERPLPIFTAPQWVVPDSRVAYGELCQALVGDPSRQMAVIGITGTSGKSTVAALLHSILSKADCTTHVATWFQSDGISWSPDCSALTPPALARWLAQCVASDCSHAIVEAPSTALSQAAFAGIRFDAACITNVGRDHLTWHNTLENYRRAKARLLDHVAPEGFVILNADDPVCNRMLSTLNHPSLTIGLGGTAQITAELIEQHANEQIIVLTAGNESAGVRTAMIGRHHLYNCLTAAAAAMVYGVDLPTIAQGLEAIERLPGRMELVRCGQDFSVFVDEAHSPDALRASLKAARAVTPGRLICVLGPADRHPSESRRALGSIASALADLSVVTTGRLDDDNSRRAAVETLGGFDASSKLRLIENRSNAIRWALDEAQPGDTVLLTGRGVQSYAMAESGSEMWDDRDVVRDFFEGTRINTRFAGIRA
jgi:UDP-N-acetylmuramoyl-L-alanyl-D-glutamate--2,6-diaminopimelate ligase